MNVDLSTFDFQQSITNLNESTQSSQYDCTCGTKAGSLKRRGKTVDFAPVKLGSSLSFIGYFKKRNVAVLDVIVCATIFTDIKF